MIWEPAGPREARHHVAKILFKPFSIVLGMIAGSIADKTFRADWERRHGTAPPSPTTEQATWGQALGAAVFRAAAFAATTAIAQRAGAKAFRNVTGFWPGDPSAEPARRISASAAS